MSRSYTSRPSVTSNRGRGTQTRQFHPVNANRLGDMNQNVAGRGRGTVAGQGARARVPLDNTENPEVDQPLPDRSQNGGEQRMTYQGGFSMITPNQKKRQQVLQVAQRETQAYQDHKQKNTPKSLNYVGTVGGQSSQADARHRTVMASPNKTQRLLQNQERKNYFKQKEEEEIKQKKDEQRKKAEQNEARSREQEAAAAHRWDNKMKITNDAFLRRLEAKNKQPAGKSVQKLPQASGHRDLPERPESDQMSDEVLQDQYDAETSASCAVPAGGGHSRDLNSEEKQRAMALAAMFPQLTQTEIVEALRLVDFSLDAAVELLQ